ncbi:MAG: ribosome maturation factor RimP [Tissierellia bacterium]|nr:ribosome maturation factor RimP [Tissierellia bacterium]
MNQKELCQYLEEIFTPEVEKLGVEIYKIQFVHENKENILRFFIEKEEGFVTIEDCEKVSNYLSQRLDELDPIASSYLLEVSSVGLDKPFERERDFKKNLGNIVEMKFYGNYRGQKILKGRLEDYDEESVHIRLQNKKEELVQIPLDEFAWIRFAVFDN